MIRINSKYNQISTLYRYYSSSKMSKKNNNNNNNNNKSKQSQQTESSILKLNINVHPNSRENQIVSFENEILSLRIQQPPIDGKANSGVIEFISKELGIRKSNVNLSKGSRSRNKSIEIDLDNEQITKEDLYNIINNKIKDN